MKSLLSPKFNQNNNLNHYNLPNSPVRPSLLPKLLKFLRKIKNKLQLSLKWKKTTSRKDWWSLFLLQSLDSWSLLPSWWQFATATNVRLLDCTLLRWLMSKLRSSKLKKISNLSSSWKLMMERTSLADLQLQPYRWTSRNLKPKARMEEKWEEARSLVAADLEPRAPKPAPQMASLALLIVSQFQSRKMILSMMDSTTMDKTACPAHPKAWTRARNHSWPPALPSLPASSNLSRSERLRIRNDEFPSPQRHSFWPQFRI